MTEQAITITVEMVERAAEKLWQCQNAHNETERTWAGKWMAVDFWQDYRELAHAMLIAALTPALDEKDQSR